MSCSVLHRSMSAMEIDWETITELPDSYEEPDKVMDGWYLKWDDTTSLAVKSISKVRRTLPTAISISSCSISFSLSFCENMTENKKETLVQPK